MKSILEWQTYGVDPHLAVQLLRRVPASVPNQHLLLSVLLKTRLFDDILATAKAIGLKDTRDLEAKLALAREETALELKESETGLEAKLLANFEQLDQALAEAQRNSAGPSYRARLEELVGTYEIADYRKALKHAKIRYELGEYEAARRIASCLHRDIFTNIYDDYCKDWAVLHCCLATGEERLLAESLASIERDTAFNDPDLFFTSEEYFGCQVRLLQCQLFVHLRGLGGLSRLAQNRQARVAQSALPFMRRYFVLASLVTHELSKVHVIPELVSAYDGFSYSDEVVEFADCLFKEYDFQKAQAVLPRLQQALLEDCFLRPHAEAVMARIREVILATKFRLEARVRLSEVQDIIGQSGLEAERTLLSVLRKAHIRARIDQQAQILTVLKEQTPWDHIHFRLKEAQFRNQFRQ